MGKFTLIVDDGFTWDSPTQKYFPPKEKISCIYPKNRQVFKKKSQPRERRDFPLEKNFLDFIPTLIRPRKKQKKTTPKKILRKRKLVLSLFTQN